MKFLAAFLLIAIAVSCKNNGQTFDPNFHVPHIKSGGLVDRNSRIVHFSDKEVQSYGCMHRDKIIVLKILLQQSKQLKSRSTESEVVGSIDALLRSIDQNRKGQF